MPAVPRLLRRLKPAYALYNVFQRDRLRHNVPLYRALGLDKRYFSPVSSADFAGLPQPEDPASSAAAQERLADSPAFRRLSAAAQDSLRAFGREGYAVLPGFVDAAEVAAVNAEFDALAAAGTVQPINGAKYMFAFRHSPRLRALGEGDLQVLATALLGSEAALFQSINFLTGSQQPTHSDSIHMSTYPLGGLVAAWVALEDVTAEQGPLHYYPGSHTLPYYLNADYDNAGGRLLIGARDYRAYEEMIAREVAARGLRKEVFEARAGDVFLWHANLLHGGEPHRDRSRTRRSVVYHYFGRGHVCYHEITQRPALLS